MKKLLVQIIKDNGSPMTRSMIIEKLKEMEKLLVMFTGM